MAKTTMNTIPTPQRILTALLAAGCIVLLQYHSIRFWMDTAQLGPVGAAWSILLEGCALWLWWQRRATLALLAVSASALLLAGPIAQVAQPLVRSISVTETHETSHFNRLELLKQQISTLENSLKTYETNSATRTGWASRIDSTTNQLEQARAQLLAGYSTPKPIEFNALKQATIGGQIIALMLYQLTAVLAVIKLSKWQEPATQQPSQATINHAQIAELIDQYALKTGLSGKDLADSLEESTTTLWRARTPGKPISDEMLVRIREKILERLEND